MKHPLQFQAIGRTVAMVALVAGFASLMACQVPVFRYALERWSADRYDIVILHSAPLTDADQKRVKLLQGFAEAPSLTSLSSHETVSGTNGNGAEGGDSAEEFSGPANLQVHAMPLELVKDPKLLEVWKQHQKPEQPLMLILYPKNARDVADRIADVQAFDDESVRRLTQSPVRREIIKRLIAGESAVWVFVPSGQTDQDSAALLTLNKQIAECKSTLELPNMDDLEPARREKNQIPVRLDFSVISLDRHDAAERLLLKLLLKSESDLASLDEPMAFPVFGRGRVLYALVGKGIAEDTINSACHFMTGPCSCQIKAQNPGIDLLLAHDWDRTMEQSIISDAPPAESAAPVLLKIPPGKQR